MSAVFAVSTVIEFLLAALLIYGFIHEDRVIAFEQSVKRIIIGNIRRFVRRQSRKRAVERGEHLRLHTSQKRAVDSGSVVA